MVSAGVGVGLVNPMSVEGLGEMDLVLRPFAPVMPLNFFLGYRTEASRSRYIRSMAKCLLEARPPRDAYLIGGRSGKAVSAGGTVVSGREILRPRVNPIPEPLWTRPPESI
jgi:hypothetical protein